MNLTEPDVIINGVPDRSEFLADHMSRLALLSMA